VSFGDKKKQWMCEGYTKHFYQAESMIEPYKNLLNENTQARCKMFQKFYRELYRISKIMKNIIFPIERR